MKKIYLSFALVVALAGLGGGCLKLGPRVVKGVAEPQTNVAVQQQDAPKVAENSADYGVNPEYSADSIVGYLEIDDGSSVAVTRDGSQQTAETGTELVDGDEIAVTQGVAYIIYPDSGRAKLDEGTDLVLLKDESADGDIFTQLRMNAGRVWTRFERLLGQDEYYSVSANGVVATVRGTAFGVEVDDEGVDIQVADHAVEVSNEAASLVSADLEDAGRLKITAGEGLKIATKGILLRDIRIAKNAVRKLSVSERLKDGFKFGLAKLAVDKLKKPIKPIILPVKPALRDDLKLYQDILLKRRMMILNSTTTFMVPDRTPLLQEILPSAPPRIIGPSG